MMKNTLIFCDVRNVTVFVQFRHIFGPPKFRSSQIGPPQKCLVRYYTTDVGIIPQMVQKDTRPPDLREACSNRKCATKLCPCKTDYAGCLKFCKCRADPSVCRNPYTEHPSDDEDEASDNNDNDSSHSYDGY